MVTTERSMNNTRTSNESKELFSVKKEAEELCSDLAAGAKSIASTVSDAASQASKKVSNAVNVCKESGESTLRYVESQAKNNPIRTLAISVGVGILLGRLLSKK